MFLQEHSIVCQLLPVRSYPFDRFSAQKSGKKIPAKLAASSSFAGRWYPMIVS